MSNPSDPKPTPDQPDPNTPAANAGSNSGEKPSEGKPGATGPHTPGGSSFDFKLPDDVGSYSDLPPVPQPDTMGPPSTHNTALPPRPTTIRPSTGSFDFIDLGDVDPASLPPPAVQSLPPVPAPAPASPPLLTPTDDAITLPPVTAMPAEGDSAVTFALPATPTDPSSLTLNAGSIDLANLPELSTDEPISDVHSVPDIGTLYPTSDPPSSFVLGQELPVVPAAPTDSNSSGSFVLPLPATPATPTDSNSSGSFVLPVPEGPATSDSSGSFVMPLPNPPVDSNSSESFVIPPLPNPLATSDSAGSFVLPPVPEVPVASDSSGSFVLPTLPEPPASDHSIPDVATLFPPPEIPAADAGAFVGGTPAMADLDLDSDLPLAEPASDVHLAQPPVTGIPTPDLEAVDGALDLPTAIEPASGWLDHPTVAPVAPEEAAEATSTAEAISLSDDTSSPDEPVVEAVPLSDVISEPAEPLAEALPLSDVISAEVEPAAEAAPLSDVVPTPPVPIPPVSDAERTSTGRSSFDFVLPEGVKTYSDMPAPPQPGAGEPSDPHIALPPRPVANRPDAQTFDLIDLADVEEAPGSGVGLPPKASAPPAESAEQSPAPTVSPESPSLLLTPTEGVIHPLPAHDPEAVVGNLEPVDPVAPASGWLDSDVLSIPSADPNALVPTAEPTPGPFDSLPGEVVESSDIFSGGRVAPVLPVEQSDVIAATAYSPATSFSPEQPPDAAKPPRPSEIALTFDSPPGGSTLPDGTSGELPVADEALDSNLLAQPVADAESIHDMPDPASADPLFDSAKLADTPELPPSPPVVPPQVTIEDSTDYGSTPVLSPDASSILADLSEPIHPTTADSSSVRVEAPGVDRTLTGSPAEGAFDLTVSDEPIPADLFGESSDGTASEATDWQSQSGSDLFAEGRTAPEIDLEERGTVEPVDADLMGDQPSLTSAPSSIFSGEHPVLTDSGSAGSADVRIGTPEPPSEAAEAELAEVELTEADFVDADAEAAEFSANPSLNETTEREKGIPPAVPPKPARKASSGDFELPAEAPPVSAAPVEDDSGAGVIDWDAAAILQEDDNATRGIPKDASLSAIMRGLDDDSAETPTRDAAIVLPQDDDSGPVVTVDWMAGSVEEPAVSEAQVQEAKTSPAKPKEKDKGKGREKDRGEKKVAALVDSEAETLEKPKPKPGRGRAARTEDETGTREKTKPAKKGGGMLVGLVLGGLLAGGAATGVYFSGIVPNSEKQTAGVTKPPEGTPPGTNPDTAGNGGNPNTQPPPPQVQPGMNDAQTALAAGDIARALELVKAKPATTPAEKAVAGSVRMFAKVQELAKSNTATAAVNDPDLAQARADLKAAANDPEATRSPAAEKRAVTAMVQLGISYEVAGNPAEARKVFTDGMAKFPNHKAVFEALIDRLDVSEKAPGTSFRMPRLTPEDAQRVLFAVTVLLADDPKTADDPEPGLYYWKAVNNAAAGKYENAIKLIGEAKAAHVKRAKALAGRGLNPLTDPLEQMFPRACDELSAYWKLREELYKSPAIAAAIKKDGVARTLDSLAKAQTDLVTAKADTAKLEKETTKLGNDVKLAEKAKTDAEDKLKTALADLKSATADLKTATADLKAAKAEAKEKSDLIASVATELKPAKVLPEKWTPADVVAGVKTVAGLATGADAQRVVKAEAARKAAEVAAKLATDKLAAETKAFKEKYDTDTAKLKTDHAAELKKLADAYAVELKKLSDDNAAVIKKLKDDNAADLKKAADKAALDIKKLTEDYVVAIKKLKDDSETALKAEQAKTEAEKKAAALKEISFQKQLANAVTPAQAMDIWLPMLTDLRRPSDADPALATAARALASAVPDSEDAAKAHTVTGMALFLKGNFPAAKDEFRLAQKNPTYAVSKNKPWAKAADAGLEAIDDPLALYRQPVVVPPVDLKAAAKSLDVGISAYKAEKYEAAAAALADAAKHDPTDPVAWYFLGAARWAIGDTKQAEKDINQGAEREKASTVPARVVSDALTPIQGAPRDAIDKARP